MNGMRPRAAVAATAAAVVIYRAVPCRACAHAPVLVPLFYTPLDFGSAHVFPITRTQHQAQARAGAEAEGQAECAESVTRSGRHMPPFVNAEGERERE